MPRFTKQNIYGLVQDAWALSGAVGALVQIGTDILNNKVRRVYKIIASDLGGAGGVLTIWQGDAAVPNRTRIMDVIIPVGATVEFGHDVDEPYITARPTTSVLPAAVQNNRLYLQDDGAGGVFAVTFTQYDMRG